jgi:hypothetical protein
VLKDPGARFENAESMVELLDRAQLSAPEIPLPIRLFSQEAATLGLILVFFIIISYLIVQIALRSESDIDAMLPVVVLFGVVMTRVLQANSEARRLAMQGFSVADVIKGMTAVVDEREELREQIRPNLEVQRRRRRTVQMAIAQLALAGLMFFGALQLRIPIAPGRVQTPLGGAIMVVTALMLFGVSFILLLRSPFRMPIGERLFRLIWLGRFGRWFVTRAGRGLTPSATASTGTTGPLPAVPVTAPASSRNGSRVSDPTLRDLDQRVQALEEWRRAESSRPR